MKISGLSMPAMFLGNIIVNYLIIILYSICYLVKQLGHRLISILMYKAYLGEYSEIVVLFSFILRIFYVHFLLDDPFILAMNPHPAGSVSGPVPSGSGGGSGNLPGGGPSGSPTSLASVHSGRFSQDESATNPPYDPSGSVPPSNQAELVSYIDFRFNVLKGAGQYNQSLKADTVLGANGPVSYNAYRLLSQHIMSHRDLAHITKAAG